MNHDLIPADQEVVACQHCKVERKSTMKAFKGFDKNMKCRDFQYEEGMAYETKKAEVCACGFHACLNPIDCLGYYEPGKGSVYHEVELDGQIDKRSDGDTKVAATKIKIGARLSIAGLVRAAFDFVRAKCTNENNAEPGKAASAGEYGAASAGASGAASAGYRGVASAGAYGAASAGASGVASAGASGAASAGKYGAASAGAFGAASAGEYGAASAGEYGAASAGASGAASAGAFGAASAGASGAASAGKYGAASAGEYGAASAGASGAASAGEYGAASAGASGAASAGAFGAAVSRGSASVEENGIACVRGNGVKVKGGIGSILVIAEEYSGNFNVETWKAFKVDGKKYKADTWYMLREGEIVEVEDSSCPKN